MRSTTFLRTPIRAEHQSRLLNLQVAEQPLDNDPRPTDIYPQTLLISFGVQSGTSEIQIAPIWQGSFKFLPDSTDGYPTDPSEVTEANFPQWKLVGDLILESGIVDMFDMETAFKDQIPLVSPPPSIVRYSKIRLTRDFLFVTMSGLQNVSFVSDGKVTDKKDPQWREKLVIAFLHGHASVFCNVHNSDPTQDLALKPMPSVHLQPAGSVTTLKLTIASRAAELFFQLDWFLPKPELDFLFIDPLVDPGFNNRPDWFLDAGHPSHSVVSPFALYSSALDTAYATEHGPSTPVRIALTAPRADGKTYRRIELLRSRTPTIIGNASSDPQRPFPMHQLVWRRGTDGPVESLRIPLSGRLYLPLDNGDHRFWTNPRFRTPPSNDDPDAQVKFSVEIPGKKFLSMPDPVVTVTIGATDRAKQLYANLLVYDSKRAWTVIRDHVSDRARAIAAGDKRWNVNVLKLFIRPIDGMFTYAFIYGLIREAALRHGLAPEFLHAVFMGEGVGGAGGLLEQRAQMSPIPAFNEHEKIHGVGGLGLDWIADDLPAPVGVEPIPIDDRDIALQMLLDQNYLNPSRFPVGVVEDLARFKTEAKVFHMTANPIGWIEAIELVAAETQARLDMMIEFLEAGGRMRETISETQRRFLAYVRYNTEFKLDTWSTICQQLNRRCAKWPLFERPSSNNDQRFFPVERVTYNSLQHLPVAEWYEQVGVYS